jgi:hypothetical protein
MLIVDYVQIDKDSRALGIRAHHSSRTPCDKEHVLKCDYQVMCKTLVYILGNSSHTPPALFDIRSFSSFACERSHAYSSLPKSIAVVGFASRTFR